MRTYETIFILNPELTTEQQAEQIEFYKNNITSNGGEIIAVEEWGKLTLAYKIEKFSEGIYVLIQFKASTEYLDELQRRYQYNDKVLRNVIVKIDEKKFKLKPRKEGARKDRRPTRGDNSDVSFTRDRGGRDDRDDRGGRDDRDYRDNRDDRDDRNDRDDRSLSNNQNDNVNTDASDESEENS